ncbi:MAG: acyl carrier protein [Gammaproteobacteria bacterium]|nr:MAG: acyl carrier protein [Gammaproteobacteria bacterium]
MSLINEVCIIVRDVLVLGDQVSTFNADTPLLGAIPEFDSMAVVSVVTALEEEFGCTFDDDEITAEVFESIGSLVSFVDAKLG